MLFFQFTTGKLKVTCTLQLPGDVKLGRSYKLSVSKNINIDRISYDVSIVSHKFIKFT